MSWLYKLRNCLYAWLTKLKLLLISRENPSVENLNAYKQFRNLYNQLIRASKRMYYSEKIDSSKHDPKSLWKTINRKQSKNSSIDNNIGNINNLFCISYKKKIIFLKNKFFRRMFRYVICHMSHASYVTSVKLCTGKLIHMSIV